MRIRPTTYSSVLSAPWYFRGSIYILARNNHGALSHERGKIFVVVNLIENGTLGNFSTLLDVVRHTVTTVLVRRGGASVLQPVRRPPAKS